jgi:putative copper resistance protein D
VTGLDEVLLATRSLHFVATLGLFGSVIFPFYSGATIATGRLWLLAAALVSLTTAGLWLALEAGAMGGAWAQAVDVDTISAVLSETSFGRVERIRLLIGVALVGSVFLPFEGRWRWVMPLAAAAMTGSIGFIGHAADAKGMVGIAVRFNQAAHLLAAGAWLGGLIPLARLLISVPAMAEHAVRRFSAMGMAVVSVLVLTGGVNIVRLVRPQSDFLGSMWGRALLVKLGLFAILLLLASLNRWRLMVRLGESSVRRDLLRSVGAEQGVGLLILAAATYLSSQQPP